MYDPPIRFLASVFVPAGDIVPEPDLVERLSAALKPHGMVTARADEVTPEGRRPRMAFQSAAGGTQLILGSSRFDLTQLPMAGVATTFQDFLRDAGRVLGAVTDELEYRGSRMAAVQEGLLPTRSVDKLESLVRRLLKLPPTFSSHPPFEWDYRLASSVERDFADLREETNTLVTLKRLQVSISGGPIVDRLRLDLDVNTTPRKSRARFGPEAVEGFFSQADAWHQDLGREVLSLVEEVTA